MAGERHGHGMLYVNRPLGFLMPWLPAESFFSYRFIYRGILLLFSQLKRRELLGQINLRPRAV
jgi:hypothetical protein